MPYALTLIRVKKETREIAFSCLQNLTMDSSLKGVKIIQVLLSLGWPDFIIMLKAPDVQLLQQAVLQIRKNLAEKGTEIDTTTLIALSIEEIEKQKEIWTEKP